MSDYTFATVITTDQAAAQADFPECFTTGLSADGNPPATSWATSGPWGNDELDKIVNTTTWPHQIYFGGDPWSVFASLGLQVVQAS